MNDKLLNFGGLRGLKNFTKLYTYRMVDNKKDALRQAQGDHSFHPVPHSSKGIAAGDRAGASLKNSITH